MASPANSQKVKKNILLEDKIDIIKKKETNTKLSDEKLANKFGVDCSTIYISSIL